MKNNKSNKEVYKYILKEVLKDLFSSMSYGVYLATKPDKLNRNGTLIIIVGIIAVLLFRSKNQYDVIINFTNILIFSIVSFFIFSIALSYWFLVVRTQVYKVSLLKRNLMEDIKRKVYDHNEFGFIEDYRDAILQVAYEAATGYKTNLYRYGLEIFILMFFMLCLNPYFFICDLLILGATYFYTLAYEKESHFQAFKQISLLMYCIKQLIDINSSASKKFILKNKKKEVRNLTDLYYFVKAEF